MSGQTVQTQIRLHLEEQSDQGLYSLLFHLHLFEEKLFVLILGRLQQSFRLSENLGTLRFHDIFSVISGVLPTK